MVSHNKKAVPYTIKRGGIYYSNLRWNDQIIRQSLATKDPLQAFNRINQLAAILCNLQTSEKANRRQISEIVGNGKRPKGNAFRVILSLSLQVERY